MMEKEELYARIEELEGILKNAEVVVAVSYTHLTLPTKLEV